MLKADSFSSSIFMRSVEECCPHLHKFCIFGARRGEFRRFDQWFLSFNNNKKTFGQFGKCFMQCEKKSYFGQSEFAYVGATVLRNIAFVRDPNFHCNYHLAILVFDTLCTWKLHKHP